MRDGLNLAKNPVIKNCIKMSRKSSTSLLGNVHPASDSDTHSIIFVCQICGKGFQNEMELIEHNIKVHRPIETELPKELFTPNDPRRNEVTKQSTADFPSKNQQNLLGKQDTMQEEEECSTIEFEFITYKVEEDAEANFPLKRKKTHQSKLRRKFSCSVCNEEFTKRKELTSHQSSHPGFISTSSTCSICSKSFSHTSALIKHQRIHSGEKPFKCDICERAFNAMCNLVTHKRIHSGEKPFVCKTCGKGFSVQCNLTTHARVHSGEKPFHCEFCDRSFSVYHNMVIHKRIHSGEKPFICDVCQKGFRVQCNLLTHMRTHSGEKPFECKLCGKTFRAQCNLNTHMHIHSTERPHVCVTCGKAFSRLMGLERHQKIHLKGSRYECTICSDSFSTLRSLKKHEEGHKSLSMPKDSSASFVNFGQETESMSNIKQPDSKTDEYSTQAKHVAESKDETNFGPPEGLV